MRRFATLILAISSILVLTPGVAQAGGDGTPPDWYLEELKTNPDPKLSRTEAKALARKDAEAKAASVERDARRNQGGVQAAAYYGVTLAVTQETQWNGRYCGQAAYTMIAKFYGYPMDQGLAAAWLGTQNGVPFKTGGTYPVENALNAIQPYNYDPASLSYSPTSAEKAQYVSRMAYAIDRYHPVAGNMWIVPVGPHPSGYLSGYEIFHWIAVRGYGNYGSTTRFADSASGLGGIFAGVPPYNEYDSYEMARVFGGKGYIW